MKKRTPSLLEVEEAKSAAAPALLFLDEVSKGVEKMEKHGEFTAERLMESRPAIYRAIVEGYAQGLGIRQLCRAYSVSHHTVAVVLAREPKAVATLKEGTISTLRTFAKLAADRLLDEVNDIPIQQLAVPLGISIDKAQLLDGGATSRIEHTETGPTHDDYLKLIGGTVIEAEILPVTGLEGGTDSLKVQAGDFEVSAAAAAPALLPGESFPGMVPTGNDGNEVSPDEQSGIFMHSISVDAEDATPFATLSALSGDQSARSNELLEAPSAPAAGSIKARRAAGSTSRSKAIRRPTEGGRGSQKSAAVSRGH
jgi:hypothetical protein